MSAVLLTAAAPAQAGGRDRSDDVETETLVEEGPVPVIEVGVEVSGVGGGVDLGPDPFVGCVFGEVSGADAVALSLDGLLLDARVRGGEVFVLIRCGGSVVSWWRVGDPVPVEVVEVLVASARSRVPMVPPVLGLSPDGVGVPFVTQLPVWFWVDGGGWGDVSASASIPELGVGVTVTASPLRVVWDPGDGSVPFVCGRGVRWGDGVVSDCVHTYTRSSGSGSLVVSGLVVFGFSVSCVPVVVCGGVSVPGDVGVRSVREVRVTEVRGVVTS